MPAPIRAEPVQAAGARGTSTRTQAPNHTAPVRNPRGLAGETVNAGLDIIPATVAMDSPVKHREPPFAAALAVGGAGD